MRNTYMVPVAGPAGSRVLKTLRWIRGRSDEAGDRAARLRLRTPPELPRNLRCEVRVVVDPGNDIVGDLVHVEVSGQFDVETQRPLDVDPGVIGALAVVSVRGQNVVEDELDLRGEDVRGVRLLRQDFVENAASSRWLHLGIWGVKRLGC